jgi:formylglycine-generating enzyme required for sulfatase activity
VTNAQFRRKEPRHDSVGSQGHTTNEDEHPVVRVSWDAASTFATWLTGRNTARSYRLPTEAEWEYACRAGSTTRYHFGDDAEELPAYAWFSLNSGETTHPVAGLAPNAWGLYDVHGNVWEWCLDGYAPYPSRATEALVDPGGEEDSGERALRGGCWSNGTRDVRSAHRFGYEPRCFDTALGFRLVSPLPEPSEK